MDRFALLARQTCPQSVKEKWKEKDSKKQPRE